MIVCVFWFELSEPVVDDDPDVVCLVVVLVVLEVLALASETNEAGYKIKFYSPIEIGVA